MVEKLEKIISQSQNIVFFGGAGVSTESGIPDFRSVDGLYHQKYDYRDDLEPHLLGRAPRGVLPLLPR